VSLPELVNALLYEGYALYPYTPHATKNATPTPFGIVYPPAYAAATPGTFDRIRLSGVAAAGPDAVVSADVRFLQAADGGHGHRAEERRLTSGPAAIGELVAAPRREAFAFGAVSGRIALRARALGGGRYRLDLCVHNESAIDPQTAARAEALALSLLSTHPLLQLDRGQFLSPLDPEAAAAEPVNTFPVLASDADDALLGAAIVLPDHPQLAPESRGSLFDGTEIEEALLLHVLALTDAERAEIAAHDPAVRDMIERAATATPEDVRALHGRWSIPDVVPNGPPEAP
jgi:hypothetical protein